VLGLSRGSSSDDVVTATLQSVAYQTHDLIYAMAEDGIVPAVLRVDGGMVANDWFLQFLADILNTTVERPANVESTILGAAYLAAFATGILKSTEQIAHHWRCESRFEPAMPVDQREQLLNGWKAAVSRVRTNG
jgi:glycerol kinase